MADNSFSDFLAKARKIEQAIWKRQDIRAMALSSIDHLCMLVEDGMNQKKALELIYKFAHCSEKHLCYGGHEDWRKELKEFYRKNVLNSG
jgi:hypothetical protein